MSHQYSRGFSFVEVVLVSILIGILAMIIIPRLYSSTNDISMDTFSHEMVSMLQTVQLQSKALQQSLSVSLNYAANNLYIESFSFSYPGSIDGSSISRVIDVPEVVVVSVNEFVDELIFYPNLTWETYSLSSLKDMDSFQISLTSDTLTNMITIYKYSGSIQLE